MRKTKRRPAQNSDETARRVLIVDDDPAMTDNLEDILEDEGYTSFSAGTCADALALAESNKPQAALLDLKLPDDSGINLLSELQRRHPDCVCALMTAFADVDSAVSALELGAFHYLQKPVRPVELLNILERIFETVQIREEKRLAERRLAESEKRFRTIVESARDAIYLKDHNLRYILVNPVMETLYGMAASSFTGRTDEELFGAEEKEAALAREAEKRVLRGEVVEKNETFWFWGKKRAIHSIRVPMTDASGNVTGLCGFTRDLTATRELEAQLQQAQKMEAIGTLAGGLSHDFNNLLQGIMGYTQMLLLNRDEDDPDFQRLRQIEQLAGHASELTARLLAFSRKGETRLKPVNLNQVVEEVKMLLERTIPKSIDIRLRLSDDLPAVHADPVQLEQVILNIGLNARDAMPDGGSLTMESVSVKEDDDLNQIPGELHDGGYALLLITDTGHGMSPEILEHLYEPFFTTKRPGKGSGLGMAMAYGVVKNHQGHIACESFPGKGTTFRIYLPAIEEAVNTPAETPSFDLRKGNGETLLVIDDEPYIRELAEEMLSINGYRVICRENAEDALVLYRKHRKSVSLVITDMNMPGMSGTQFISEILDVDPNAKILVTSGLALEADPAGRNVLANTCGLIRKPYDFKALLDQIGEILAR